MQLCFGYRGRWRGSLHAWLHMIHDGDVAVIRKVSYQYTYVVNDRACAVERRHGAAASTSVVVIRRRPFADSSIRKECIRKGGSLAGFSLVDSSIGEKLFQTVNQQLPLYSISPVDPSIQPGERAVPG